MATNGSNFPAQRQETQPGKQHVMDPVPGTVHPDYKPANKLQVFSSYFLVPPSGINS